MGRDRILPRRDETEKCRTESRNVSRLVLVKDAHRDKSRHLQSQKFRLRDNFETEKIETRRDETAFLVSAENSRREISRPIPSPNPSLEVRWLECKSFFTSKVSKMIICKFNILVVKRRVKQGSQKQLLESFCLAYENGQKKTQIRHPIFSKLKYVGKLDFLDSVRSGQKNAQIPRPKLGKLHLTDILSIWGLIAF